ncbi:MAG: hypothetical protein M4579_000757 [Chaenotheca gracillima]|nr:MAG: hypothetical protein M4579_000757 [Chaenotheca gracillima]
MWRNLLVLCNLILSTTSASLPRAPAGAADGATSGLRRRGGSVDAHTCLKDEGSGYICDSQTNIDSCNTAVDEMCHTAEGLTVQAGQTQCGQATSNDCTVAFCLGETSTITYADCVAGFQDIMADCIDPNGAGFSQHLQGGDRNVHFDDTSAGALVDSKSPSWTIGAKKCMANSESFFVPAYMPGSADIP